MDEVIIMPDLIDEFRSLIGSDNIAYQYAQLYYIESFTEFVSVPGWFISQFNHVSIPDNDI